MGWSPTPPLEAFAEALSVPPMIHTPPRDTKVLVVGAYALPLAKLALRYPSTTEVLVVVSDPQAPLPRDRRIRRLGSLEDIPDDWRCDVAGVAVPGDVRPLLGSIDDHLQEQGVIVVAVDRFARGRVVKDAMRGLWPQVLPYREHAPDPALFILASKRRLGRPYRPIPSNLGRLTPRYLSALFQLAKDEYQMLYGEMQHA